MLTWFLHLVTGKPHKVITTIEDGFEVPQLLRWYLIPRNRFFNVYLHHVVRDDIGRDLHDHPWWSFSFLLFGSLSEVTQGGGRRCGFFTIRKPTFLHRLILPPGSDGAWTLFITGPKVRQWGFQTSAGWVNWRDYFGEFQ